MICAGLDQSGNVVALSTQPIDLSGCAVVLVTGEEYASLTKIIVPTASDFAFYWSWGFSMVVVTFLVAWFAGKVVNMFGR